MDGNRPPCVDARGPRGPDRAPDRARARHAAGAPPHFARISSFIKAQGARPGIHPDFGGYYPFYKTSYRSYYDELLPRLSERGVLVFDNVLWMGAVADAGDHEESTRAIRALNDFVATDPRADAVMLPVADGITLVRRRG